MDKSELNDTSLVDRYEDVAGRAMKELISHYGVPLDEDKLPEGLTEDDMPLLTVLLALNGTLESAENIEAVRDFAGAIANDLHNITIGRPHQAATWVVTMLSTAIILGRELEREES